MKTIIWDWNGTLLDDAGIAVQADNILLARHGLPPVSLAWYRDHVEVPVERYYAKLFNLDQAPFEQLAQQFMEEYHRLAPTARLAGGAREALEALQRENWRQVIISSFEGRALREYAERFGVSGCFAHISGEDGIFSRGKVERAVELLAGEPGPYTVVGDMTHDYDMARALGADCILVSAGHQSRPVLERCGVPVLESLWELPALLHSGGDPAKGREAAQ